MNRLKDKYQKQVRSELQKELDIKNVHDIPRLTKIVVSAGVGRATQDSKHLDPVVATLTKITGQKPVITKARKSIATFKLREGNPIGVTVTLRGDRMYYFMDRLVSVVIPRLRDFHGVSIKSFDKQGNYSLGFREQTAFAEISFEEANITHGIQINIISTAKDKTQAMALLKHLGMPFEKGGQNG
ncbi:50S ribosomal protein L5 [bacterium]|nr:50S ribosomal protein L5 [bacterium]